MLQEIWPIALIALAVIIVVSVVYPQPVNYLNSPVLPGSFLSIILCLLLIPPAVAGIFFINSKTKENLTAIVTDIQWPIGILILITMTTLGIVVLFCMAVNPIERFTDMSIERLTALESRTCKLIDRADQFIQGEVGSKGMTTDDQGETHETGLHQKYVIDALTAARKTLGGELLSCPTNSTDTQKRLETLELTLRKYIGPIFLRNFDTLINSKIACTKSVIPCGDANSVDTNVDPKSLMWTNSDKITAIEAALTCYEKRLLTAIDTSIDRTKRGDLSDCEKANAVKQ